MNSGIPQHVDIGVGEDRRVSGLLQVPAEARAGYVLAHGAGAGMAHPFLAAAANGLGERGLATLRYQFPYMENGGKRPDPPRVAHLAVRAAVEEARRLMPGLPLFAGGKSFGGRMTSQAQTASPLPGVGGLVFLGFPFHAPGPPSEERAQHLFDVQVPMLFLQGTRDDFAELSLVRKITDALGPRATLTLIAEADHSFHVRTRSGRTVDEVRDEMLDAVVAWIDGRMERPDRL